MTFMEMTYRSKALGMDTSVWVLLPEKSKQDTGAGLPEEGSYKTLYLLHGLSGDRSAWIRRTNIERYASQYGIAVVMPEVARSWYTDTQYGVGYFTFVAEELPAVCQSYFRGMSDKREDNFVAGLSMGGYGALKTALTYPERFAGCASLSGSVDITRKNRVVNLPEWRGTFDFAMETPLELEGSKHDLFALASGNRGEGKVFPKIFQWCGTEDGLIVPNRLFHEHLTNLGVEHTYRESEGNHSWKWWDLHIQDAMEYLFGEK